MSGSSDDQEVDEDGRNKVVSNVLTTVTQDLSKLIIISLVIWVNLIRFATVVVEEQVILLLDVSEEVSFYQDRIFFITCLILRTDRGENEVLIYSGCY